MTNLQPNNELQALQDKVESLEKTVEQLISDNRRLSLQVSLNSSEISLRCVKIKKVRKNNNLFANILKIFIVWLVNSISGNFSFEVLGSGTELIISQIQDWVVNITPVIVAYF